MGKLVVYLLTVGLAAFTIRLWLRMCSLARNLSCGGNMLNGTTFCLVVAVFFALACAAEADYPTDILGHPDLVAYYRLNETSGVTADNAEGTADFDATYLGSPDQTASGPQPIDYPGFDVSNTGVGNDGTDKRGVVVSGLPVLSTWSIELWGKSDDVENQYGATWKGQVAFGRDGTANDGWADDVILGLHPEGWMTTLGHWAIICQDDATRNRVITEDPDKAQNNTWQYVVATYDGSYLKLYVDGSLKASTFDGGRTLNFGSLTSDSAIANSSLGWLGQRTHGFYGVVDEVAIYSSALSLAEVTAHHEAAQVPEPSTFLLAALGLLGLGLYGWRRRKRS